MTRDLLVTLVLKHFENSSRSLLNHFARKASAVPERSTMKLTAGILLLMCYFFHYCGAFPPNLRVTKLFPKTLYFHPFGINREGNSKTDASRATMRQLTLFPDLQQRSTTPALVSYAENRYEGQRSLRGLMLGSTSSTPHMVHRYMSLKVSIPRSTTETHLQVVIEQMKNIVKSLIDIHDIQYRKVVFPPDNDKTIVIFRIDFLAKDTTEANRIMHDYMYVINRAISQRRLHLYIDHKKFLLVRHKYAWPIWRVAIIVGYFLLCIVVVVIVVIVVRRRRKRSRASDPETYVSLQ